jgi:SAM-dependent methyltransferase
LDPLEYELMYRVEDHHWWYLGMEKITRRLLDRWLPVKSQLRILDAGCGTGAAMTTYLTDYGKVTGVDLYPLALEFCRKRKASRLSRASILDLPFAPASFDLVTSFDVLYERGVSNEVSALREFSRVLTVNGRMLLRLPAYDWLRGQHDKRIYTNRRYTKKLVRELLEQSGLVVEHLSYANTFLFPLAVLKRLGEKLLPAKDEQSDLEIRVGVFNGILKFILAGEAPLVVFPGLPFGLSVIAIGRKAGI